MSNKNQTKKDPSSMSGLAADETATTMLTDGEPTNKDFTGEQLEIAVIDEVATISNKAINDYTPKGTPTPAAETPEELEARLAAEVEAAEAQEREVKAKLKAEAEAAAAELLAKSRQEAEANDRLFKADGQKLNERQFMELIRAVVKLQINEEHRNRFIALGFPPNAFELQAEQHLGDKNKTITYKVINTVLQDRHFIEVLKLSLEITLKQTAVDNFVAAGFPAAAFTAA